MKHRISPWAILAAFLSLWFAPSPAFADGPQDNVAKNVRPVPPPGVEISAEERQELLDKATWLEEAIADLEKRDDARIRALLPDVQIFAKAVRWAVEYDEVFNKDDLRKLDQCTKIGLKRAAQLGAGKSPWTDARGLVVRGYVSKIDGSVQPYGLVIPESYTHQTAGRYRLDVWFHGRGETLSEANFLADRMKNRGQFAPPDTIVLHPYGRYCNAFKLAGEVDVLEAFEDVKRQYRVDEDRISVRGFSMGGAAAWHFAVHYPSRWFAANPGAGFSETPEFLRVFQNETIEPTPWEKSLLHYYDCTDWARNISMCPTVAYSGEIDSQKQAADIMAKALAEEGMELQHVIGPGTKHAYHPQAAVEVERRMSELAKKGRTHDTWGTNFVTYTLRFNRFGDVTVDSLKQHWKRSEVQISDSFEVESSELRDEGEALKLSKFVERYDVQTNGVAAFTLTLPAGRSNANADILVAINGHDVTMSKAKSDGSWTGSFHVENSQLVEGDIWESGPAKGDGLRKRHGLQGPIDDAFLDSFLFVRPTGKTRHEAVERWSHAELDRAIGEWRRQMRGDARVKDDTAVTDADIAAHNLVLWGDPASNAVLGRIAEKLPVRWGADKIAVGDKTFAADSHAVAMIYPNPLNPDRYVVLNSSFTYREYDYLNNARQVPKLPDWAIVDLSTPAGPRYPGKIAAADFFDEAWQLK
ncbi:MAG: prolyl oligopeptidase family serine peptidase [Pirellulales bacterium]